MCQDVRELTVEAELRTQNVWKCGNGSPAVFQRRVGLGLDRAELPQGYGTQVA